MKKNYISILLVVSSIASIIAQPTITSFFPIIGPIGTAVVITGTNFNTTAANNSVYFGAAKATVISATSTSLSMNVPAGANYEYISVTNLATHFTAYSAKPFEVSFGCANGINSGSFTPKTDYTPGNHPVFVQTGDIDGDGKPDLAEVNYNDNTVSVFRNTSTVGNISFAAKVDFTVGSGPWCVYIGDIDGDGKLDLAVSNGNGNSVSVLKNTSTVGSLSFATHVDFTTGTSPFSVCIGDLDGDGKPDLAVTNYSTIGSVSIFHNTGSVGTISFAPKADYTTGNTPQRVSIGDLDGDGKPDLAVADYNTSANAVSTLRNTSTVGTISFAAKVDFPTGTNPYNAMLGDIDGDGKPDVVVTDNSANNFSVLRNTSSSGTISFAAHVDFSTGSSPVSVAIDDFDGDGKLDVAISNQAGNTISLYKNTSTVGNISFNGNVNLTTDGVPYSISAGDLDGDGRTDIAVVNAGGNLMSVYRNLDCPLGVAEFNAASPVVNVYPNPFSNFITIETTTSKLFSVKVIDVLGNQIMYSAFNYANSYNMDLSGLSKGIYFLQVTDENKKVSNKKIIKE